MEGLWSATFTGRVGTGHGVVVFSGDNVVGGDGVFYWIGTYAVQGETITAKLQASSHSGVAEVTVLGTVARSFSLELSGSAPTNPSVGSKWEVTGTGGMKVTLMRLA